MDKKPIIILISIVAVFSGCTDLPVTCGNGIIDIASFSASSTHMNTFIFANNILYRIGSTLIGSTS